MNMKVAVVGAGRMGGVVGGQLPEDVEKLVIDTDEAKAKACATLIGGIYALDLSAAADADLIAMVIPAPAIPPVFERLFSVVKDGAIIINMATGAEIGESKKATRPAVHVVDCKIIGNAAAMAYGAPCYVVAGTKDEAVFKKIAYALSGYKKVVMGEPSMVPILNALGSEEGIRCGVLLRKKLKQYNLPKDWEDVIIYTVAAGTMQTYAMGDLGHFAQELADKIAREE